LNPGSTQIILITQAQRVIVRYAVVRRGFCPRDRILGMEHTSLSPAVTRLIGITASAASFYEADEYLRELAGVCV
jgi:hypothetical protein